MPQEVCFSFLLFFIPLLHFYVINTPSPLSFKEEKETINVWEIHALCQSFTSVSQCFAERDSN